jgi:membrane fusion protein (multidrug efflux system)
MPDDGKPSLKVDASAGDRPATLERKRAHLFVVFGAIVAVAFLIWAIYWLLIGSRWITTDNAYVAAETTRVAALVAGPVLDVPVRETQVVKKGDVLAIIEPSDQRLAVARAQAEFDRAGRQFVQTVSTHQALTAQTGARRSELIRAQALLESARSDYARSQLDYERRRKLVDSGAVSGEELTQAQNRFEAAKAALRAAQAMVAQADSTTRQSLSEERATEALISGVDKDTNPDVAVARANLDQARLDLDRTVIRAPIDGVVARKAVEAGQRVTTGSPIASIVPIQTAYVEANFKEGQLRKLRLGQPVIVVSDLYGPGIKFHGRVAGFAGGTGVSFALLPAQNATGNWIKVVQRVPVRIELDPEDLRRYPLRLGLSMTAKVDVRG